MCIAAAMDREPQINTPKLTIVINVNIQIFISAQDLFLDLCVAVQHGKHSATEAV